MKHSNINLSVQQLLPHRHHIDIIYKIDSFYFSTKLFYDNIDLYHLNEKYTQDYMYKIYCHIALIEGLKYCSVFPKFFDLSQIADGLSESSLSFFTHTYRNAYTQNMYENNISTYEGPELIFNQPLGSNKTISLDSGNDDILMGNGGGKDSLLLAKILEKANMNFSLFQWARSEYGKFDYQYNLSSKLCKHITPKEIHPIIIYDDFTDGIFVKRYYPNLAPPFTLGTPECIFEALPIILDKNYHYLTFGNEKSSDTGNLFWEDLGREVNHQWIKSFEAETLFNSFIRNHLISNFNYFSLFKPIYDFRIFQKVSQYPEALPDMHSCNIYKPWCKKCPKCAYVWLGYLAFFDTEAVNKVFKTNPFDDPDLFHFYKQLVGANDHKSFECVGNIEESRFYMKKCIDKGLKGNALRMFEQEILNKQQIDWNVIERKYTTVDFNRHNIPDNIFQMCKQFL